MLPYVIVTFQLSNFGKKSIQYCTDAFESFPFPPDLLAAGQAGVLYKPRRLQASPVSLADSLIAYSQGKLIIPQPANI